MPEVALDSDNYSDSEVAPEKDFTTQDSFMAMLKSIDDLRATVANLSAAHKRLESKVEHVEASLNCKFATLLDGISRFSDIVAMKKPKPHAHTSSTSMPATIAPKVAFTAQPSIAFTSYSHLAFAETKASSNPADPNNNYMEPMEGQSSQRNHEFRRGLRITAAAKEVSFQHG